VLTLSRVSSLTLLPIYLLFIVVQIRATRRPPSSDQLISHDDVSGTSSAGRDTTTYTSLLVPRSIRFQDEEAAPSYGPKDQSQRESLELSALDGSESSRMIPEEELRGSDFEFPANDDEQQPDKTPNARNSIYQFPANRTQSASRSSSRSHISPARSHRPRFRSSFTGSTSSLPRLHAGSSVTSNDKFREVYTPNDSPPQLGRIAASLLLTVSALLVAICAEFLVDTLDEIVESGALFSGAFIGLIILPVAGNCAELFTATCAAWDGNFDLAIHVAVGSSVQISLLVTPLVVLAGWAMHIDMSMYFDLFGTVALFASTFLVTILILHGKSNLLEGSLLLACYFIIGVGAYLFPRSDDRA